ncbi:hypothetical protein B0T26DRAFT_464870 [Lasiosphaeria miniovina]|uniref:Secreted protein n=1 Tax=Lasiosphaeria miniovina TaxID=1954250 RepID=A0AA39ZZT7_9PEZI|nr:uncharacterized protein B0T26DRAFT_464870 [Lasiosphaeria miniovina]KAK0706634.1 hypothetical protein B0T26DRAFT_464870 [Lasiosphaeria miniovina]
MQAAVATLLCCTLNPTCPHTTPAPAPAPEYGSQAEQSRSQLSHQRCLTMPSDYQLPTTDSNHRARLVGCSSSSCCCAGGCFWLECHCDGPRVAEPSPVRHQRVSKELGPQIVKLKIYFCPPQSIQNMPFSLPAQQIALSKTQRRFQFHSLRFENVLNSIDNSMRKTHTEIGGFRRTPGSRPCLSSLI